MEDAHWICYIDFELPVVQQGEIASPGYWKCDTVPRRGQGPNRIGWLFEWDREAGRAVRKEELEYRLVQKRGERWCHNHEAVCHLPQLEYQWNWIRAEQRLRLGRKRSKQVIQK